MECLVAMLKILLYKSSIREVEHKETYPVVLIK